MSYSVIAADLWRRCPRSQFHYSINRWRHRGLQGQCPSDSSRHDSLHRLHPGALPSTGAHWDFVLSWIKVNYKSHLSYSFFVFYTDQLSDVHYSLYATVTRTLCWICPHAALAQRKAFWRYMNSQYLDLKQPIDIWIYCCRVVCCYLISECVFLRWCSPRWRRPKAHPMGVPEISGKSSRVQHHWGDLQTHPGWVRAACQWDFIGHL